MEEFVTYSRRKPKWRGHYWYRTEYGQDCIVSVHQFSGSDHLDAFVNGEWVNVRRCKGQFAKRPIPSPQPLPKLGERIARNR